MEIRWVLPLLLLTAAGAHAQDAFEIQVYNAETAAPLQFGAEQPLLRGQPRARGLTGPEKWIAKLVFAFDVEPAPAVGPASET